MTEVRFVVREAGCPSCAARLRDALEPLGPVEIEIDEAADEAAVRLAAPRALDESAVVSALREASTGSGHTYSVRPGSWTS